MLCWNVYYGDFNSREIVTYNIFNHWAFYRDCVKAKKKYKDDKDGFAEEIRKSLMYFFWSKCEWEIVLTHWPSGELYELRTDTTIRDLMDGVIQIKNDRILAYPDRKVELRVFPKDNKKEERKIDVYDQVMNNWDVFIDYLWNNRKELKARK